MGHQVHRLEPNLVLGILLFLQGQDIRKLLLGLSSMGFLQQRLHQLYLEVLVVLVGLFVLVVLLVLGLLGVPIKVEKSS